ncbi:phospholipase D family protein [Tardiphaga sp. 71_E8_N1_1]|uniref:phospholipase D family protein n=1 Tax=Tardiphaga sp. 71_E8_N1_1 TaxID=3240784 RepID=UPI003F88ED45
MPIRTSLDPETRVLYGDSLQPPPGYIFDAAVATTFSLDFETALAVPVSLALFAAESREDLLENPLALLEGAERIAGRLVVYADAGHLRAQGRPHSRLCSLLESIVVEVAAPREGVFHPKMWALRYRPIRPDDPTLLRLLILSRNLTRDRSWDISLRLDGELTRRPDAKNRPLFDLISRLPDLNVAGISDEARAITEEIAENIRRAQWTMPEGFDDVAFALNGFGGKSWQPDPCTRLGVISPFCDTDALDTLANLPSAAKPILISRSDQLACIDATTLDAFGRVAVLDETAATDDGEELSATALQGLHAKAFIAEIGWSTVITVGSGNATRPAIITGRNIELFASIWGARSKVGSVEQILGDTGFGRLTRAFVPRELEPADQALITAQASLESARRALCRGKLRLRCEKVVSDEGEHPWRVWLMPTDRLELDGIGSMAAWPITRGDGHARDVLSALQAGEAVDLGTMPLIDVTRFMAFRLADENVKTSLVFSTGLPMDGLPAERHAAIMRWIIDSRDTFFRYLRLLLSELGDPFGAALAAQKGAGGTAWSARADDAPLLEEMVRALCRGGERLRAVERLVARLEEATGEATDPIPPEFYTLWNAFRLVLHG